MISGISIINCWRNFGKHVEDAEEQSEDALLFRSVFICIWRFANGIWAEYICMEYSGNCG